MLGVVFQDSVLDKPLTVKENLKSRAALYGITGNAFDKRLMTTGLVGFDRRVFKQTCRCVGRVREEELIARALLHRPEILILTSLQQALIHRQRQLIWNVIEKKGEIENMTISNHSLYGRGC